MITPMAETQSAPSLRELSEAVPQCEWKAQGRYIGTANHMSLIGECRDENGNWSDTKTSKAKAAFVARLASDYFAGRLIDPTTLTEAVAAARAEGRAAGLEEAARISETYVIAPGTESFVVNGHKLKGSYDDHEFIGLSVARKGWRGMTAAIRDLIPAPPTTPGGRTDG